MNSVEALKGFLTFLLLVGIFSTSYVAFNLTNNTSLLTNAFTDNNKPTNIILKDITKNSVIVNWETKKALVGEVIYSTTDKSCLNENSSSCLVMLEQTTQARTNHSILIGNLEPNTTYYIYIKTPTALYPLSGPIDFRTF